MKLFLSLLAVVLVAYGVFCLGIFLRQKSFIYFPRILDAATVAKSASAGGLQPWIGRDGTQFGWKLPDPPNPTHAFVFFHGNGGLAVEETFVAQKFRKNDPQAAFYILEYPGYADMPGTPSEKAIVDLTCLAVDDLAKASALPIYLVGESLGTGVACETGALCKAKVSGLLLLTPFDRIASVAAARRPYLPINLLLRERFDSALHLRSFDRPVAIVVAANDTVILPKFGVALYTGYQGPKKMMIIPDSGHNDVISLLEDSALRELLDFLKKPKQPTAPNVAASQAP